MAAMPTLLNGAETLTNQSAITYKDLLLVWLLAADMAQDEDRFISVRCSFELRDFTEITQECEIVKPKMQLKEKLYGR
jgi:hypothetical protein